mmetsp:Transcript_50344/g.166716  ORF Transcript_50344/g.166716 Transcript_50344/m.166716 type:complete len:325 (-) Transcript_50344:141-1115(-)
MKAFVAALKRRLRSHRHCGPTSAPPASASPRPASPCCASAMHASAVRREASRTACVESQRERSSERRSRTACSPPPLSHAPQTLSASAPGGALRPPPPLSGSSSVLRPGPPASGPPPPPAAPSPNQRASVTRPRFLRPGSRHGPKKSHPPLQPDPSPMGGPSAASTAARHEPNETPGRSWRPGGRCWKGWRSHNTSTSSTAPPTQVSARPSGQWCSSTAPPSSGSEERAPVPSSPLSPSARSAAAPGLLSSAARPGSSGASPTAPGSALGSCRTDSQPSDSALEPPQPKSSQRRRLRPGLSDDVPPGWAVATAPAELRDDVGEV